MKLQEASGKNVIVTLNDGKVFKGNCEYFTPYYDNEEEISSICIRKGERALIEIFETEIVSIEEIK